MPPFGPYLQIFFFIRVDLDKAEDKFFFTGINQVSNVLDLMGEFIEVCFRS